MRTNVNWIENNASGSMLIGGRTYIPHGQAEDSTIGRLGSDEFAAARESELA
jgi:hypothetical protein